MMSTSKPAKSPPLVTPTAARKTTRKDRQAQRLRFMRPSGKCLPGDCSITVLELDCDPANIAEFFTDDIHYRVDTRGYFWGFFD